MTSFHVARSVVVCEEREEPLGDADGKIQGELVKFFDNAPGGDGFRGIAGDEIGLCGDGDDREEILDCGRKADGEDFVDVL